MSRALITGITGQDGSYLAEFLLGKGYRVVGVSRHLPSTTGAIAGVEYRAGDVSEPVETPAGFHILRVDEVVGEDYRPVEDVEDEIRDKLYGEALERRYQDWITRDLRERHHVEVLN